MFSIALAMWPINLSHRDGRMLANNRNPDNHSLHSDNHRDRIRNEYNTSQINGCSLSSPCKAPHSPLCWIYCLYVSAKQMENTATNTTIPGNPPYNWMGEPKQRGTFGIMSLCFSTLIICIWSTLHFNVPTKRYTVTRRFFIQVFWMILALLAPEVLLFLAINERITAGVLLKKVLKFHPHLAKPGMFTRTYNWICGRAEAKGVSAQFQSYVIQ